jgi:hypothetical protein
MLVCVSDDLNRSPGYLVLSLPEGDEPVPEPLLIFRRERESLRVPGESIMREDVEYDLDDTALQRDVGPISKTPLVEGIRRTLALFKQLQAEGRLDASDLDG